MIERYELYCLTDRLFYDRPHRRHIEHPDFPISEKPVPAGWERAMTDVWASYAPSTGSLPAQGWKIHVSARTEDAERVIAAVWDYCVPRGIAFKFLRSRAVMVMHNSKSAMRGSSGKLLTVYPPDEAQLELALKELDAILGGTPGPYVLSDLRYGDGPLYVRYGGFTEQHCLDAGGRRVLAIEDGDGNLVPDVRGPVFSTPPWVALPEFLREHLRARNSVTVAELAYEFDSVLVFSNGGGVYLGHHRETGERVVLKEARPHAGLDVLGRDAVTRLEHERDILLRLDGLDVVPAVRDYLHVGDHRFLVLEFVDGTALQRLLVQRYPLTKATCTTETLAEYTEWVTDTLGKVERAVAELHERGVVFGDLHPDNILVTEDGRVVLIDFEVSSLAAAKVRSALAHPGFGAPGGRQGVDVDRYALACLQLGLFAPHTTVLLTMNRNKAAHLAGIVADTFPVPPQPLARAVDTITAGDDWSTAVKLDELPIPGEAQWSELREAMRRAIVASATPERDDRLFPGDIGGFRPGGAINIANGAAGVLYALHASGAGVTPEHVAWLRSRALRPEHTRAMGFYDGLPGVAFVLDALGHRQDSLDVAQACLRSRPRWPELELGLHGGLAGVGLTLLHLAGKAGETRLRKAALDVVDLCASRLGGVEDVPEVAGGDNPSAGLLYGSSGVALLFLHAYAETGDAALLDLAAVALRQDLRRCVRGEDGTLQVNQGWRTLPYLDEGSAGIGLALARYLEHRDDAEFADALAGAKLVTELGYFVQSGLFTGRAGLLACRTAWGHRDDATEALVSGLRWHTMPYGDGLAFPGDQLLRLSMDFATGTAGVLFALATALHEEPVPVPFCEIHPRDALRDT